MHAEDLEPLCRARVAGMSSAEKEVAEAEIRRAVVRLAERHCREFGRELDPEKMLVGSWFLTALHLQSALIPHTRVLDDPPTLACLRGLFAELIDLMLFAYDGEPAYPLYEISRAFGSGITHGPILPLLLPARAAAVLARVDEIAAAEHEDWLRRLDQMGY